MEKACSIYRIIDPITKGVVYVGKTVNPKNRFATHMVPGPNSRLNAFMLNLKTKQLTPIFEIIEECPNTSALIVETQWIRFYLHKGVELLNKEYKSLTRKNKNLTNKVIGLDEETIKLLTIQALENGFKNFKTYAEHILTEQSKVKSTAK